MDSPLITAILVFISIYVIFFLIRLFADFLLAIIAIGSAILAFNIKGSYNEFKMVLEELNIFSFLNLSLPAEPTGQGIFMIAIMIVIAAILVSIPVLPFSATYRQMLGVETSVFARKENKVRAWIAEEIQRQQKHRN
ncbi:MAG: hypothetical protein KAH84_01390 [Thiomargarita sp.]|nr:hypothetical protein [Thiomargarita sp.]